MSRYVPDNKVTVFVVDEGGDTAIRVEIRVLLSFLFTFVEVEVDKGVIKTKFLKNENDLPTAPVSNAEKWMKITYHPLGGRPFEL